MSGERKRSVAAWPKLPRLSSTLQRDLLSDLNVRRAKARFPSGRQTHPATFAPAGSNRSSRGGNKTAEASGVEGHFGDSASMRAIQSDNGRSSSICLSGIQGSEPDCMTRLVPELRSTSHTVAARDGCTNIPLAAGRAQKDENHSRKRRFRPWPASVRRSGSVRTDPVLRITVLDAGRRGYRGAGYPSAHIFPERDQQLSRQRHDRRLAPTTAVTIVSVLEPEGECRARLMA